MTARVEEGRCKVTGRDVAKCVYLHDVVEPRSTKVHMMGTRTRLVKTSRRLMGAAQGIRSTAGFRCGAMEARVRVGGRGGGGGHGGGGEDEEITIIT
jgi:hypothetical protein